MKIAVWIKTLLAIAPTALFLTAPAPVVHADGACTALANPGNVDDYNECLFRANAYCKSHRTDFLVGFHFSCGYPDGGRDECDEHVTLYTQQIADYACTYFPPGSAPAPVPGAAPEPAGEPVTTRP